MPRLIPTMVLSLLLAAVVYAATAISFYSGSSIVTQAEPTTVDIQTNAVGDLHVWARFDGKGAQLEITGPASCSNSSGRFREVFCTIANAPIGNYHITVAPKASYNIQNVYGSVTGEFTVQP